MAKWMDDIPGDRPVTELARQALDAHLRSVWRHLAPAAEHADEDIEYVHDLRVASRRAVAAINLFGDMLPKRRRKWFDRNLRKARHASGEARDLDVFAAQLAGWAPELPTEQIQIVANEIAERRRKAQPAIEQISKKLQRKDYPRRVDALLSRVCWREDNAEPDVRTAALAGLQPVVERFVLSAGLDFRDFAQMHRFRVAGKRLRYAVELLVSGFDRSLPEQIYPQLVDLQDRLGEINDHVSALARLGKWQKADRSDEQRQALKAIESAVDARLRQLRRDFLQWWTADRAGDLTARLTGLVAATSHPATAPAMPATNGCETNGDAMATDVPSLDVQDG